MDISLSEGELMTIYNDFHHAHYSQVLEFDMQSIDEAARLPAQILKWRAQIALGQAGKVLSETKTSKFASTEPVAVAATEALATFASGKRDFGVAAAEKLATEHASDPFVMVLAGTVLAAAGDKTEEALALLGGAATATTSLEAVAVLVQVHLAQNRVDLAAREVQAARRWAQDSLLFNIADSWVGLRLGGDRYQQAFYEFEEMPVAQAVAELHLGRLPEAEAALNKHLEEEEHAADPHALANLIVLQTLAGKAAGAAGPDVVALKERLAKADAAHPLLADLREKADLFDQAAAKFSAKAAS